MNEVQIYEGETTISYVSNNLLQLMTTAARDLKNRDILDAELKRDPFISHKETGESPFVLVVWDRNE